jgi:hypothetical protein
LSGRIIPAAMALINAGWTRKGTTIDARCDLVAGWHRLSNSHGYSEQEFLDMPGDHRIRVQITVKPNPSSTNPSFNIFPAQFSNSGVWYSSKYSVDKGALHIEVPIWEGKELLHTLGWFITENGKLAFDWMVPHILHERDPWYQLRVLGVIQHPPSRTPPTVRDWERRFFPGGLPSLGKRN